MPTKTYTEIISEMRERFVQYNENYENIKEELKKLKKLKENATTQGDLNIEIKIHKLINDKEWEERKLHKERREFYNRLKALNLLEEEKS
jgi:exonuclease III